MAAAVRSAAASSSCITTTPLPHSPTNLHLRRRSLSSPQKLPFPHKSFQTHHLTPFHKTPTSPICHVKFDGSSGGDPEDISEMFFDDIDSVEDYESDDEDDDESESSIDLFFKFLQSMLKKISKRAKKASRSVLPTVISPQLVSFAVDGILLLAALSIVKALLEVVCSLGSTVFAVILLLRVVWAAISYFQSNGNTFNQRGSSFGGTQPVA
ncbi:protein SHORT HYPOCOTYL IN WHITE LIGHT 1 [Mercurialis annua]|uniref:protein SHORT HYPOCOTYL IN WHITE LIGHT 1 n=1 Tax=Mercurialis annua TaxID=3986 RepID=UPI00215F9B33|nr:protein SHORT HYPOCOTYL IN WHITE LIGHT 1 [Mercurialis annua]